MDRRLVFELATARFTAQHQDVIPRPARHRHDVCEALDGSDKLRLTRISYRHMACSAVNAAGSDSRI